MIQPYLLLDHIAESFGTDQFTQPMTRQSPDEQRALGITEALDWPTPGVSSWATLSASEFATPYHTQDGTPVRVEFVAAVDARWEFMGDALAACAFAISESHDVRPGTVYRDAVGSRIPQATTPHLLSVSPFMWRDFPPLVAENLHVTWMQLVPITDAEAKYCSDHGFAALEDLFDQAQPDVFSIERQSVVGASAD